MKNLTLPKLDAILFFCALSLGTFCACEKSELEMIDAIELENATEDGDISIKTEDLRSGPELPKNSNYYQIYPEIKTFQIHRFKKEAPPHSGVASF